MMNLDLIALRNQHIGELKAYSKIKAELELTARQRDFVTDLMNESMEVYNTREYYVMRGTGKTYAQGQNPTPERLTELHKPTRAELFAAFGWGIAIVSTICLIFY